MDIITRRQHRKEKKGGADGGSVKDLSHLINLEQYVKTENPELYELFDDLVLTSSLRSVKRGQNGLTLIVPSAAYMKSIRDMAKKDVSVATEMLLSLLVPLNLQTPADWDKYQDDISTLSGKRLEVKKTTSKTVEIKNASLSRTDTKFAERFLKMKRGNMAVWEMTGKSDSLPDFDDMPDTARKYVNREKTGANEITGSDEEANKLVINKFVEDILVREMEELKKSGPISSVILRVCCNYIIYVQNDANAGAVKTLIKLLLHPNPYISFFLMFCSHGPEGVIPREYLVRMISSGSLLAPTDKPLTFLKTTCDECALPNMQNLIDLKKDILDSLSISLNINTPKKICQIYESIDTRNSYGRFQNLYPQEIHEKFKAVPGLHMILDQAVYYMSTYFDGQKISMDIVPMRQSSFESYVGGIRDIYSVCICIYPDPQNPNRRNVIKKLGTMQNIDEYDMVLVSVMLRHLFRVPCCNGVKTGGDDSDDDEEGSPFTPAEEDEVDLSHLFADVDEGIKKDVIVLLERIKDKYPNMSMNKIIETMKNSIPE